MDNNFPKCHLSCNIRKDIENHVIENSTLINIRVDNPNEAVELFHYIKSKLNEELMEGKKIKREPEFKLNFLSEKVRVCPDCGSELVKRVASKGAKIGQKFLACPRYPMCSHTEAYVANAK